MKRVMFFPFHPDLWTLAEYHDGLKDYQIVGFHSYKEDYKRIQALNEALRLPGCSYDKLLKECDTVILIDNYRGFKPDKYYQTLEYARQLNKEVLVTPLAESQLDLSGYRGEYGLLEKLPDRLSYVDEEYNLHLGSTIYDINVPIVGIFGQGKHCDKFPMQLLLKKVIEESCRTSIVSSNALGALFGCYTMPAFLYDDLPFQEKICKFNYYVRLLSKTDKPDVLLLGIPEGIAPFRKREFHHFAEYPLVVTSAVPIDLAIICTYLMNGPKLDDGLKEIAEFCEQRFEIPVGAAAISRTLFSVSADENDSIAYEFIGKSFLDKLYPDISGLNFPVIDFVSGGETSEVSVRNFLRPLQENVSGVGSII